MVTVILAGGLGSRMTSIDVNIPKPMIRILKKPILEYQLEVLKQYGFTEIILVVGHLKDSIINYFGDGSGDSPSTHEKFGVKINYIVEQSPLGTAGVLYYIKNIVKEDFLFLNGDIIFDIDFHRLYTFHKAKKAMVTLFTHPNSHPYDSALIIKDSKDKVVDWLHKEDERMWYGNCVNAGIHIISSHFFETELSLKLFREPKKLDLDRDILKPLIKMGHIFAYVSPEYVKDMGTPKRLIEVEKDIKSGLIQKRNLQRKQKAIFLDRDGTINQYVGFLTEIDEFQLIDGVAEAIKLINQSNYLVIVVTNQPIIARGEVSQKELKEIHNKMETLLGKEGAYLNDILYCPHHPDKGFNGERINYKISCTCRKPQTGLLLRAADKYNIDLKESWMIGDGKIDMEAGLNAGCKVAQIVNQKIANQQMVEECLYYDNLLECIKSIIGLKC